MSKCGLTRTWVVADIGSGPGNLGRLFLDHGNAVVGVEPNKEMREAGESLLASYDRFSSVNGTAEATTLADASVDLVIAGQAFHWFEPDATRAEFCRILRPPQWVALVWNDRSTEGSHFVARYDEVLKRHASEYPKVSSRRIGIEGLQAFLGGGVEQAVFESSQTFDLEGLLGRAMSSSYVPHAGQPGHDEIVEDLTELFERDQENGTVRFLYETQVFYGTLR